MSNMNLYWMLAKIEDHIDIMPVDKMSRWIGFVQGVLAMKGALNVDAERDRTRPFFHAAYTEMGIDIPPSQNGPTTPDSESYENRVAGHAEEALMAGGMSYEEAMDGPHRHLPFTFHINHAEFTTRQRFLSYEEIVALAFPNSPKSHPSVIYRPPYGKGHIMIAGSRAVMQPNTRFYCVHTGNA